MGEVVNLRTARKRRERAEDAHRAEENRVRFGRTKAQKQAEEKAIARDTAHIDNHRREP